MALDTLCENAGVECNQVLLEILLPILQLMERTLDYNNFGEEKSK